MFEYLDLVTFSFVEKISDKEFNNISYAEPLDYPFLGKLIDMPQFWSDLMLSRFGTLPIKLESAKKLFQAEYQYSIENYEEAANLGSFNAGMFLVDEEIKQKNYGKAMDYAKKIQAQYQILGYMYCLKVCQNAIKDSDDSAIQQEYAVQGLSFLESIETIKNNPETLEYLRRSDWDKDLAEHYKDLDGYINMGKDFFSRYCETSTSLKM